MNVDPKIIAPHDEAATTSSFWRTIDRWYKEGLTLQTTASLGAFETKRIMLAGTGFGAKAPGRLDLRKMAEAAGLQRRHPLTLPPVESVASQDQVERLAKAFKPRAKSPTKLAELLAKSLAGCDLDGMARRQKRLLRYVRRNGDARMPTHLRETAIMASTLARVVSHAFPPAVTKS